MESLIKTTIESLDVSRTDQPFYFDENKIRMDKVLENVKPVKINIPLLGMNKKFCIQIKKS